MATRNEKECIGTAIPYMHSRKISNFIMTDLKRKIKLEKKKPEEPILWIVRYESGDIGCLYGSRQEAEEYATKEAEKKGSDYVIV